MCLEQSLSMCGNGWCISDIDQCAVGVTVEGNSCGIDAVLNSQRAVHEQVGGWEADISAQFFSVNDGAVDDTLHANSLCNEQM